MSKKVLFAVLSFALVLAAPAWSATLSDVQGDVLIARVATPDTWEAGASISTLESGDTVKTTTGSCSIVYDNQATFQVQPNSQVTLKEEAATQDLHLKLGYLKAKIDSQKALKPFQVVTPVAVCSARGTDVDFGFDENGQLTVDLLNGGPVDVHDAATEFQLELAGQKKITVMYDPNENVLYVQNDCGSDGEVSFTVLGSEYSEAPCDKVAIPLSTAAGAGTPPGTPGSDNENPDEHDDPISPV